MKRFLLFPALAAAGLAAFAEVPAPVHFSDVCVNVIAPNGSLAASSTYQGGISIIDLKTNEIIYNCPPETANPFIGVGNCISNNGIVLVSLDDYSPQYWKDGEVWDLDYPFEVVGSSCANGITPDGTRICGYLGLNAVADDEDVLMNVPCIWESDGEGGYAEPKILPYPTKDYTGRIPQYVMCNEISDDGKTIIGTVRDSKGYICFPILFREDENGEWSYELVHSELYLKEGLVFPEYPGEGPAYPDPEAYLGEESFALFEASMVAWAEAGYPDGEEPLAVDFLTEEEREAWMADSIVYNEWNDKFLAWTDAYNELIAFAPSFQMNDFHLSADGKYMAANDVRSERDEMTWMPVYTIHPWIFNLETGAITKYEDSGNIQANKILYDGVIMGSTSISVSDQQSYILKDGTVTDLYTWMKSEVPEYAEWMEQNLLFSWSDVEMNEEGEYEEVQKQAVLTGIATATPDLSIIGTWISNNWDYTTEAEAFVFNIAGAKAGVDSVAAPIMEGDVIFDMQGRQVRSAAAPGIYIINGQKRVIR